MITISNTEMTTWDRCRRKWLLGYYLGFVPADEPVVSSRLLGIRVHTALEGFYGYELDPSDVLAVIYQMEIAAHPDDDAALTAEYDMAMAMVTGYLEWTEETAADADLKVVATETDLQIPMPGRETEVLLRCRMDQVVHRISDSALLFLDHKTAASFERHELLALDPQMRHYCLMQRLAVTATPDAPVIAGGIVNTLRRVKRTDRSKPPYYQRDPFMFNPEQIAAAWHRTNAIVREILEARQKLDWFFAQPGSHDGTWQQMLDVIQREHLRPTAMLGDCSWSCPLAGGLCTAMDDGSDWLGMLERSGHWKRADPYEYYREDPIATIRAALSGSMAPDQGEGDR